MEWILYPVKLWNLITAFAYIVLPVLFIVVFGVWYIVHPRSADKAMDWFMRSTERFVRKG